VSTVDCIPFCCYGELVNYMLVYHLNFGSELKTINTFILLLAILLLGMGILSANAEKNLTYTENNPNMWEMN